MTDQPKHPVAGDADRDGVAHDARLAQALRHMPDAHMQPRAQTRQAVLQAALQAAKATQSEPTPAPMSQGRWWHRWVGQPGEAHHGIPWSAALVSVLVVGFVAVLWQGQEVLDAEPDHALSPRSAAEQSKTAAKPMVQAPTPAPGAADAPKDNAEKKSDAVLARSSALRQKAETPAAAPLANTATLPNAATAAVPKPEPERKLAASPAAAPVATTGGARADAPESDLYLERRSKSMQAEVAPRDRSQAREARSTLRLTLGDVRHSVQPAQAQKLINLLRDLPYGPASAPLQSVDVQGDRIQLEWEGQEIWVITPGYATHRLVESGAGGGSGADPGTAAWVSTITPAQYAALRSLVLELAPQH